MQIISWYLHIVDKLTSRKYVKTINLLSAGDKVFVKYNAQRGGGLTPTLPSVNPWPQSANISSVSECDSLSPRRGRKRYSGSRLLETRSKQGLRGDSVQFIALEFRVTFNNAQRQHLPTLKTNCACLYHDKSIPISRKTIDYFGRQRIRSRHTSDLTKKEKRAMQDSAVS